LVEVLMRLHPAKGYVFKRALYDSWCKKREGCYPLGKILANTIPKEGGHTPCQDIFGGQQ